MSKRNNIESARIYFEQFTNESGMVGEDPAIIVGDLICNLMHFLWNSEVTRKEGIEVAMNAVHSGIYHFATEVDYPMDVEDDTGSVPRIRIIVDRRSEMWDIDKNGIRFL